jgi:hypothetical protein
MSYRDVIDKWNRGFFDAYSQDSQRELLECEGTKRIEGFIFEKIFVAALEEVVDDGIHDISQGWSYVRNGWSSDDLKRTWFRLITPNNPTNHADREMLSFLDDIPDQKVVFVYLDEQNVVTASMRISRRKWTTPMPIERLFIKMKLTPNVRPVREIWDGADHSKDYDRSDAARATAISSLFENFSDDEMHGLMIERLFMNGILSLWFGRLPIDIDAIGIVNSKIEFFETKRINPNNRENTLRMSYRVLDDLMFLQSIDRIQHMLCYVDPIWNKRKSPLPILKQPLSDYSKWVYCRLSLDKMTASALSDIPEGSRGFNEGAGGGESQKRCTPWDICFLVGTGRRMPVLREMLISGCVTGSAKPTSYDDLRFFHEAAEPFLKG